MGRNFSYGLGLLLFTALLVGLSGCGGGDESGGKTSGAAASGGAKEPVPIDQIELKTVEGTPRLAYVTNGVDPFWVIAESGVKDAARELGVEATVLMPPDGVADQKRMIEDQLASGVNGIAVSPIDSANQTDLLNQAADHTNLITHDSDAPESDRILYIGMSNYDAGRMCGKLVKEAMPDGGSVMIFVGRLGQDNARLRRQGVIDELLDRSHDPDRYDEPGNVLTGDKYTVLDTRTDQFDYSQAKAQAQDAIARYPDLGAMVGLFAYNPPNILEAVRDAGKTGTIKIVGFDENEVTLAGIRDGDVYGTVVQNPYMYGYKSMEVLKALASGDKSVIPESRFIDVPARMIREDSVMEFWKDLNGKLGKEMPEGP